MGKKTRIILVTSLVVILVGLGWLCLAPNQPDPIYHGKQMSLWMKGFADPKGRGEFIRTFPNFNDDAGLVILMAALDKKDTATQRYYKWFWSKLPSGIKRHLPIPADASTIHFWACMHLGMRMQFHKPAIPKLLTIIESHEEVATRSTALNTLRRLFLTPHENDEAETAAVTNTLRKVAQENNIVGSLAKVALMTTSPFGSRLPFYVGGAPPLPPRLARPLPRMPEPSQPPRFSPSAQPPSFPAPPPALLPPPPTPRPPQ